MSRLDTRSVAASVAVILIGLALLTLVLPSFALSLPVPLLSALSLIIPLLVIAALVFIQRKPSNPKTPYLSHKASVITADVAVVSALASLVLVLAAERENAFAAGTPKFVLQNTAVALLFIAFAAVLYLVSKQKFVYWPFWNRADRINADERQVAVRSRVYERAYGWLAVVTGLAALFSHNAASRRRTELVLLVILAYLGVPAILAAWRKDS